MPTYSDCLKEFYRNSNDYFIKGIKNIRHCPIKKNLTSSFGYGDLIYMVFIDKGERVPWTYIYDPFLPGAVFANKRDIKFEDLTMVGGTWAITEKPIKSKPFRTLSKPEVSKTKRKSIPKQIKDQVWDTYIGKTKGTGKCWCCEQIEIRQTGFHAGHVVAASRGGSDRVDNLRPICRDCNLSMGAMDMNDYIKRYRPASTTYESCEEI